VHVFSWLEHLSKSSNACHQLTMSNVADHNEEEDHKGYGGPYTPSHPVPTVQKYREHRDKIESNVKKREDAQAENGEQGEGTLHRTENAVKKMFGHGHVEKIPGDPYPSANRNTMTDSDKPPPVPDKDDRDQNRSPQAPPKNDEESQQEEKSSKEGRQAQTASQAAASLANPRAKRKAMKHMTRNDGGREVTDPVTHLPIIIHDSTGKDLKKAPENEPSAGSGPRTETGLTGASKSDNQLDEETREEQAGRRGMQKVFPPPNFDEAKLEFAKTYRFALAIGIGSSVICTAAALIAAQEFSVRGSHREEDGYGQWRRLFIQVSVTVLLSSLFGSLINWVVGGWLSKRVEKIWEDEVWDSAQARESQEIEDKEKPPESTQWLNSLFASVWPLINPDLFTSLADALEDVMQASLPKFVRMISVDDLGQGSEAVRILGMRWLPTGAAARSVDAVGNLKSINETDDRKASGREKIQNDAERSSTQNCEGKNKADTQEEEDIAAGMEAEQGDFVNMEIAFAYRARSTGKSLRTKSKNAHLYLKFYLPGSIALPVWVEMRGIIGTMRVRLQLTPDPPFFSLATITFLGQPKADLSCVPLSKHSLNIMDLPLISSFVQSSIDAALAEYVAPKSLTLDLKDMLVGDDFKKDTLAHGVVVVRVKKATDFKEGDGSLGPFKEGSSDPYVTTGWGKYGKPIASTRIIIGDQRPVWDEYAHILVRTEELNAREMLRIQLWDSDRTTADDDLGRVEVDLKDLMESSETKGKMCDREDRFKGPDGNEEMPGKLSWSVGYFAKAHITAEQLAAQTEEPDVDTVEDLKNKVGKTAERKLREATARDESKEISQQEAQDYKEREDALIISSPPPKEYPSGIVSIQIHQITGLELEQLNKDHSKKETISDSNEEDESSDDLPSSYCTIILNHTKVFRTRTKPKNAKPFFNAGCERFIRDWRSTELMISVRDSRVHENDPLLGVIYFPLSHLFEKRSQIADTFPLVGGIGYGRARISLIFRSIELQAPRELLGWEYGTLEVNGVEAGTNLPDHLKTSEIKFRTSIDSAKLAPDNENKGNWKPKHHKSASFLPVKSRYSSPLMVEFYRSAVLSKSVPAFAVLWLKDIPDEEEKTVNMQVWKASEDAIKRAQSCVGYEGMEENEKPLGELRVTMKFWRGLSGYHKGVARRGKEVDLHDVMEVLDTAHDNKEGKLAEDGNELDEGDAKDTDTTDSSSDDSEFEFGSHVPKKGVDRAANGVKDKAVDALGGHNDPDDGKRGPSGQLLDYKDHHKSLHRKHRGLMQWKGVRTVDWMMGKAGRGKEKVEDVFRHHDRELGIQTEV
jgi:C2 domain